ncbi:MAG: winged helix-turn-helix transcriptional regulator [Candidatus Dormibacteria bacterium]
MALAPDPVDVAAADAGHDPAAVCTVYHRAIELIGKRWTGAIVSILFRGPQRFHVLVSAVPGMSERLCADRLRELETAGLVSRRVLPGPPVGVEYALTEAGRDLSESLGALGRWAHRWLAHGTTAPLSGD